MSEPHTPTAVPRRFLPGLLAGAAVLRVAWWIWYVDVLENEGVEYVRLATNWLHGHGYVSIFGGTHTLFPPFYPLLTGLFAPLAGSEATAARLVQLLAGVFLVWALYRLALRAFGEKAAAIAGLLAATHPLLIALSVSTYSEGLYAAIAAAACLLVIECLDRPSWGRAVLAGFCVAAGYLTRPEALVLAPLLAAVLLGAFWYRGHPGRGFGLALALGVSTLLVSAPYMIHLTRLAGSFRWEGKSGINNLITARTSGGMVGGEAGRGLTPEGEPAGAFMFRNQAELLRRESGGVGSTLHGFFKAPLDRLEALARKVVRTSALGGWPIVLMAIVGLVFTRWWREKPAVVLSILTVPLLTVMALLTLDWIWDRYLFPLLPALVLFASAGLAWLHRRTRVLVVIVAALVLLESGRGIGRLSDIAQTGETEMRVAGDWIRQNFQEQPATLARPLIMTLRLAPAHYAEGEVVYLPWAEEETALRFMHRLAPDFILLHGSEANRTPYAVKWLRHGVGDPCAEPVTLPPEASPYRVWRWKCGK